MASDPSRCVSRNSGSLRLLDLDSLKAIASLFIVLNHASYNLLLDRVADPLSLSIFEHFRSLALAFVPLRVPLFFMIAGIFTAIGLKRYPVGTYFKLRFIRILIPFLFGSATFAFIVWAFTERLWGSGRLGEAYWQFISPTGNQGYGHLWFLFSLIVYSLLTMAGVLVLNKIPVLQTLLGRWRDFLLSHRLLFVSLLFAYATVKLIARSRGLFDLLDLSGKLPLGVTLWNANYFALGVLFGSNLPAFYRFLFFSLRNWVFIFAGMVLLGIGGHFLGIRVALLLYSASANILPLLVLLALFHRYFNICPEPLRTMADYSFPVFLLHMPILSAMTAGLIVTQVHPLVIFFIMMAACYPITIVAAKMLTRIPFFALVLQGKWKSLASLRATGGSKRPVQSGVPMGSRGVENSCS